MLKLNALFVTNSKSSMSAQRFCTDPKNGCWLNVLFFISSEIMIIWVILPRLLNDLKWLKHNLEHNTSCATDDAYHSQSFAFWIMWKLSEIHFLFISIYFSCNAIHCLKRHISFITIGPVVQRQVFCIGDWLKMDKHKAWATTLENYISSENSCMQCQCQFSFCVLGWFWIWTARGMSLRKVTLLGPNLASVTDLKRIHTVYAVI